MMENKFNYKIVTSLDRENGAIEQTLEVNSAKISNWILKTQDAEARKALIELGWTPPNEDTTCHCGKPKHPSENECLGCDKRREEVAAERAREFEEEIQS